MSGSDLKITDGHFIEGLRSGNSELLKALYKKYYNVVLKLVVNNSGTSDEAKDIYQEAIIVLYENVKKPEFRLNCQLQTYIYSVAKRLWLKHLKKNGNTFLLKEDQSNELVDVTESINVHYQKEQDFEKIKRSFENLGEPCATLIKDFYIRKMSMEDIADKFGYTNAANAKTQKYKCLQRLKKYFFDKTIIEEEGAIEGL